MRKINIMKTREEKLLYDKEYRAKNKDKAKQYRIENKERLREQRIKYDEINKEKIKEQQKLYNLVHSDEISKYSKQYHIENIEKIKQYPSMSFENRKTVYAKYKKNNVDKVKNYKLFKNYGITLVQYEEMHLQQEGKCKICGIHQDELNKKLVVDHDHNTNIIRGLLCDKCNRGLGHFNDDFNLLSKALKYLE